MQNRLLGMMASAVMVAMLASAWQDALAQRATAAPSSITPAGYRISPGDVVSVMVRGETDLSRDCQVNGEGTISYPLLGDIPAAGLTCGELADRLQEALRKYLRRPQVGAVIRQYGALGTNVFVTGEVRTPGLYPLAGGTGLVQALAAAGGPTKQASGSITILKAQTGEVHVTGLEQAVPGALPDPQAALDPGDVIVVNRKPEADQDRRYTVLGEVPTPGMFEIPEGREVRVLDAIEKAGLLSTRPASQTGPLPSLAAEQSHADLEHALLTRDHVVVALNLRALLQGDVSQNLLLQPGDVVTVPRRPVVTVYALGEVHTPGRQMVDSGSTVLDLLSAAGGVTSGARLSDATLLRVAVGDGGLVASGAERRVVEGTPTSTPVDLAKLLRTADPRQNTVLREGDVLFVPARGQPGRDIWAFLPLLPYVTR
jgi:polysaccharide export outer membrane protein